MRTLDRTVDAVLASVDEAYVVDLARRLVRIPSVYSPSDPERNESAVADLIARELQGLGLAVHVEDAAPARPNVIGDWTGGGADPLLILEGHSDVVTEGDPAAWSVPPFGGMIAGGCLFGRGAADMKGGIAAAIGAVRALGTARVALSGRVRVAIVADEEGMMLGIKEFIRRGWARGASGAVICEPEENSLCLVQKGAVRAMARFRGKMAHGAMPKSGVNPIPAASAFIARVQALERQYVNQYGQHALLGEPSITPTVLRAGDPAQLNVVHADAAVGLDIRTIPGQDHGAIQEDLRAAAETAALAIPGCRGELEVIEERPWTETPAAAPVVRAVERACWRVQRRAPRLRGVPGATDGTFLHAWGHVPVVTIGPGDVTIPHQVDEFVRIADLLEASRIYAAAICYALSEGTEGDRGEGDRARGGRA